MGGFCRNCGTPLNPNAKFCRSCGVPIREVKPDAEGRVDTSPGRDVPSPLHLLKESIRAGMDSFRQLFKTPKRLIPLIVMSALWLILALLPALGINPWPVKLLSFLTFAQGGMYGGVWGAVGGVLGKAVFAYFVSALVSPLFMGRNPFKSGRAGKDFFSGLALQSANAAASLAVGVGLALVVYNFLTGNASLVNSMAGVTGLFLAIRSILRKGGFLWGLALSIVHKLSRGRVPSQLTVSRVITGYAAGSALGVLLSAVPWPYFPITVYIPYMVGGALIIIGLLLGVALKSRGEAVSA